MKHIRLFSFILLFFSLEAEQFSDVFKPHSVGYLYDLFDRASPEKKEELNQHFHIKKIFNARPGKNKKIVSYSLFWKAKHLNLPQPTVTEEGIHQIMNFTRATSSFYNYYVFPMIQTLKKRALLHPEFTPRIYLAADLEFLIPHLLKETQAEIYLMSSSSLAHSPGAMWRFLAFDDPEAYFVCVNDSDEYFDPYKENEMDLWLNDPSTNGWFRVITLQHRENLNEGIYSPIVAFFFGFKDLQNLNINVEKAIKGFILHRQLYPEEPRHPRDVSYPVSTFGLEMPYGLGNDFPSFAFDERFLKHVIYYDAAYKGILTCLSLSAFEKDNAQHLLDSASPQNLVLMDLEFVRLFNPQPIYGVTLLP